MYHKRERSGFNDHLESRIGIGSGSLFLHCIALQKCVRKTLVEIPLFPFSKFTGHSVAENGRHALLYQFQKIDFTLKTSGVIALRVVASYAN